MSEQLVGTVTHYFTHAHVAAIDLAGGPLNVGDKIHVVGHTSDFTQEVNSMQIEHESVQIANAGDKIGVRVVDHAREHDKVFKVAPD